MDSSVIAAVEPAPVNRRVLSTIADMPLDARRLIVSQVASTARQQHQRRPNERGFHDGEHACDPRFIPMLALNSIYLRFREALLIRFSFGRPHSE
jgi:hypothetical protein